MKINFILPFVNLTGGIKILFEHANHLAQRSHAVTISYPGVLFHDDNFGRVNRSWRWRAFEAPLRAAKYRLFVDWLGHSEAKWFALDRRVRLHRTPDLSARYQPEADIVIATAPETVNWVADYPPEMGVKVHFAQDYEAWYLPENFLASTFRHRSMHLITIGQWQKELYEGRFGRRVEAIIPDGVDTAHYRAKGKKYSQSDGRKQPVRVLMSYHNAPYKGIADGLAAIKLATKGGLRVQTVMFGLHPLSEEIPADVEYHRSISEAELPNLYRSCDIFLWPTHREGFGLPPMEAMACGTPTVSTLSGATGDYISDGRTGFLVPIKDPTALAAKLRILIEQPSRRQTMGEAAAKAMLEWDWSKQTDKLEQYLESIRQCQ